MNRSSAADEHAVSTLPAAILAGCVKQAILCAIVMNDLIASDPLVRILEPQCTSYQVMAARWR